MGQDKRIIDALDDELEVVGLALLAQERLANQTPVEGLVPVKELAETYGLDERL